MKNSHLVHVYVQRCSMMGQHQSPKTRMCSTPDSVRNISRQHLTLQQYKQASNGLISAFSPLAKAEGPEEINCEFGPCLSISSIIAAARSTAKIRSAVSFICNRIWCYQKANQIMEFNPVYQYHYYCVMSDNTKKPCN